MEQTKLMLVRLLDEYLAEAKALGLRDPATRELERIRIRLTEDRDENTLELPL